MSKLVCQSFLRNNFTRDTRMFRVDYVTNRDTIDAIELRGVLEGCAARMAAEQSVTTIAIERLKKIGEKMSQLNLAEPMDDETISIHIDLNIQFHTQLVLASGSRLLVKLAENVCPMIIKDLSQSSREIAKQLSNSRNLRTGHTHQLNIIDAILSHQGSRAEALAREMSALRRELYQNLIVDGQTAIEVMSAQLNSDWEKVALKNASLS